MESDPNSDSGGKDHGIFLQKEAQDVRNKPGRHEAAERILAGEKESRSRLEIHDTRRSLSNSRIDAVYWSIQGIPKRQL